jgi:5,10-methylenetetrahydromethanopterin reductase
MTEYFGFGKSEPGRIAELARADEADGWDGLVFTDSQNLRPDVYAVMATAVAATTTLKVATGVANPVTRHAAGAASAMAAIQAESAGRAVFGIGRGDSALAYIGAAPCSLEVFERFVRNVRAYLNGQKVPFDQLGTAGKSVTTLDLGNEPAESWLRWLDPAVPPVPVEVVGTGPKVIAIGGREADYVTFTVGADLERLQWAMDTARAAAREAGRAEQDLRFGAYLNVVTHHDIDVARMLVSGGLTSFSRFSAMHGKTTGPMSGGADQVFKGIRDQYDMTAHAQPGSAQTSVLTTEFIDRFAVVGDPDRFLEKICQIVALGFDRLVLHTPNQATRERYPVETAEAHRQLVTDVLPHLPR